MVIGERGRPQEQADSVRPKVLSCRRLREFVRPWCVLAMRSKALLVVRERGMYRCGMVNVMGLGFGFE